MEKMFFHPIKKKKLLEYISNEEYCKFPHYGIIDFLEEEDA